MLSSLQHYAFCPRRCALLHLEMIWVENIHTAQGRLLHENVHVDGKHIRDGVKIVTDLELHSQRLELHGRADVVEFQKTGNIWLPYPVEYKKGSQKKGSEADFIQLCAQAMCLEEMLNVQIPEGAIFYITPKRRHKVDFDYTLRKRTEQIIIDVKEMLKSGDTPRPSKNCYGCDACSINSMCMPTLFNRKVSDYIKEICGDWS